MSNKTQTIWIGASFLVLGLILGLLVSGPKLLSDSQEKNEPNVTTTKPAEPKFVNVSVDDDPFLGSADAKVTIVEFSDYQCPWCYVFWSDTFSQLKAEYIDTGKIKYVYRDFPVKKHPQSQMAAEAAECTESLGGDYFAMHDKIFFGQVTWSGNTGSEEEMAKAKGIFISYAKDLGVDITACLENSTMASEVANDYTAARAYGVQGTPTFYINGLEVVGAQDLEFFKSIIDPLL